MSEHEEAMERMRHSLLEVQLTIADRFTPAIRVVAHSMHVLVFEMWPWYRRYWHVLRGCQWGTGGAPE